MCVWAHACLRESNRYKIIYFFMLLFMSKILKQTLFWSHFNNVTHGFYLHSKWVFTKWLLKYLLVSKKETFWMSDLKKVQNQAIINIDVLIQTDTIVFHFFLFFFPFLGTTKDQCYRCLSLSFKYLNCDNDSETDCFMPCSYDILNNSNKFWKVIWPI